jgi:hypothetical protein
MAGVYAPDGELLNLARSPRPVKGMASLIKGFTRLMAEREFLLQMTHSGVVEVNGDTAVSRWWFSEIKRPLGGGAYEYKWGVYQDEVVRLDIGWRYQRRIVDTLFSWEIDLKDAHQPPPGFFLPFHRLPGRSADETPAPVPAPAG